MEFFKELVKDLEDTSIMEDGLHSAEFSGYIDTGSYLFNGLLSADIFGGAPNNKVIGLAGDPATGKTFFSLDIVSQWLNDNPEGAVFWYDTESAVSKDTMKSRGIDTKRVFIKEPETVEEFRSHAVNVLEKYLKINKKERPPMLMVLDSLGMLSTLKELKDISEDKRSKTEEAVRDMTRPGLIRGAFRALRIKLARANVMLLVTCHTYAAIGSMSFDKEISGGSGLKYAADIILHLSKAKDKDGTDIVGNFITVKNHKNRLARENQKVTLRLSYTKGLDRYYGLVDYAIKAGVWKKISTRIEVSDGGKHFEKAIYNDPEKFFTQDVLEKINAEIKKEFSYGSYDDDEELRTIESSKESGDSISQDSGE